MLRVQASVLIRQPIEEVFRFVATDFKGDHRLETPFQVTQDDPYHTFSWETLPQDEANRASFWQSSEQVHYTFDPLPEGTRVTCEIHLSLGRGFTRKLAERFLVGPLRAILKQLIANLKEQLEAPASAAPQQRKGGLEEAAPVFQPEERQKVQLKQGGQAPSRKPFPKKRVISVITGLVALLFSLAILHDYAVYQSYVQSACVITAASVNDTSSKGARYQRYYAFTVSPTGGPTYASHDFLGAYYTSDEAQAALSQYEVGATYLCWYNPANPTRAALSHAPYSFGLALLYTILAFAGYSLAIGLVLSIVVYAIVPPLYLLLCGRRTTGTIVGEVGSGRSRKVRVSYSVADRTYELTESASSLKIKIGQTLTVLFDPRGVFTSRPRSDANWVLFLGTPMTLLLLGVVLTLAYLSWFLVV
jgi:hypothetical protein